MRARKASTEKTARAHRSRIPTALIGVARVGQDPCRGVKVYSGELVVHRHVHEGCQQETALNIDIRLFLRAFVELAYLSAVRRWRERR
jgi:hypothetical protein